MMNSRRKLCNSGKFIKKTIFFQKELSLCNKIFFSNPNILTTWWCKPLIFKTKIILFSRIHILKYLRSTPLGLGLGIRTSECVADSIPLMQYIESIKGHVLLFEIKMCILLFLLLSWIEIIILDYYSAYRSNPEHFLSQKINWKSLVTWQHS